MPEQVQNPVLVVLSALVSLMTVAAGVLKWQRDGQKIAADKEVEKAKVEAQREIERAKNETARAQADTAAHAQTVTGLTALCNAQHEQIELLQKLRREELTELQARVAVLTADVEGVKAREAECRDQLASVMNRLGLEG